MNTETETLIPAGLTTELEVAAVAERQRDLNSKGTMSQLPVAELTVHPLNPRDDYAVDEMVDSFKHSGFIRGNVLTVSKRADGTQVTLRGNRRLTAAQRLAQNDAAMFKTVFPNGKIPCLVLTGLTVAEEIAILIDHGRAQDRKGLNKWEELTAISRLMQAGIQGREAIARALDLVDRKKDDKTGAIVEKVRASYVQPRLNLLALPVTIREAYKNSGMFGGDDKRFGQADIAKLYTALGKDRTAGTVDDTGFGPELSAAWLALTGKQPNAAKPEVYIAESKGKALLQGAASRNLQSVVNVLAGFNRTQKLAEIDAILIRQERAESTLAQIADFMGETEFAALVEKARIHTESKAIPVVPEVAALPDTTADTVATEATVAAV